MSVSASETCRPESPGPVKVNPMKKFNIASLARHLMDQKKQDEKKVQENR